MYPRVLLPLLAVVGRACTVDEDCSLAGVCSADGTCACDAAWTGATCAALSLEPAEQIDLYDRNLATSSWGGNVVFSEEDGMWHLFFAEFLNECPLGSWETNSVVAHAVAPKHSGPFVRQPGVVQEAFHHNPSIARAPDGTFLLYSIGNGGQTPKECRGGALGASASSGDAPQAGIITVSHSSSVNGPWTTLPDPVLDGRDGEWDAFVTNPSVYIFENGTVLMAYRGGFHPWHVGIAVADSWRGPYRRVSDSPVFEDVNEDPGLFRDARGNFHMLTHYFTTTGGHAFSRDGLSWTFAGSAYEHDIALANGTSFHVGRRERPQVLVLEGEPAFLYVGVQMDDGRSLTLGQAITTNATRARKSSITISPLAV